MPDSFESVPLRGGDEMDEQHVFFGKNNIRLEGLYAFSDRSLGAVISHPHPLMGGEMGSPVVRILAETLNACGISTLCFNFRGVGRSAGRFDEGRGEQDDVLAAASFLEEQGIGEILPVGYSFGAWVNAGVLRQRTLLPAIFVSPPINMLPFEFQALQGMVGLIICGDRDRFCPLDTIRTAASELPCRLDIIPDADHFFLSREQDLAASMMAFATRLRT
jgi:alpha/beta superfamily hydrolase